MAAYAEALAAYFDALTRESLARTEADKHAAQAASLAAMDAFAAAEPAPGDELDELAAMIERVWNRSLTPPARADGMEDVDVNNRFVAAFVSWYQRRRSPSPIRRVGGA